ncbi:MAG TPA: Gfo/Idh/MocA family oxidoreductase [Chitinispirillaceae bacterium]|nr:Gfo/Idh/MocA family oxidoreductase [Chitinispirillaceae bacterium]
MKEVRVAFVGCGRISDLHQLGYQGLNSARIVAVCDRNKNRAQVKAKEWGVQKVYTEYSDLLADPEIDMVELLVPHHLHAKMVIDACRAGKHVSVQKPMAISSMEADSMIREAQKAKVLLRIYENFIFYEPFSKARKIIDDGEIGTPQMIRIHFSTGTRDSGWKIPLESWAWRFDQKKCGGGLLVFDHGYHLFSLARFFMGDAERVCAWIDKTTVMPLFQVDAPATIMIKFKDSRKYGVIDFCYTPQMKIDSQHYSDDNRIEIVGEKGIILINRCTAKTIDLPELMVYNDGKTRNIPIENVQWKDSFIKCTRHFINVLQNGGNAMLDGKRGKAVLDIAIAAEISAMKHQEIKVSDIPKHENCVSHVASPLRIPSP